MYPMLQSSYKNGYSKQFVKLNIYCSAGKTPNPGVCAYVCVSCAACMGPDVLPVSNESTLHLADLSSPPFSTIF